MFDKKYKNRIFYSIAIYIQNINQQSRPLNINLYIWVIIENNNYGCQNGKKLERTAE